MKKKKQITQKKPVVKSRKVQVAKTDKSDKEKEWKKGQAKVAEYVAFVEWISTPEIFRKEYGMPRTQGEYAIAHGHDPATLSDWKKKPDFHKLLVEFHTKWGFNKVAEIMGALTAKCAVGNARAGEYELWLQYFTGWTKKVVIEGALPLDGKLPQEIAIEISKALTNIGMANLAPKENGDSSKPS